MLELGAAALTALPTSEGSLLGLSDNRLFCCLLIVMRPKEKNSQNSQGGTRQALQQGLAAVNVGTVVKVTMCFWFPMLQVA